MVFLKVIGKFAIRLLRVGDKCGPSGATVWKGQDENDLGVEFYDVSKSNAPYFISRYYLSTLRGSAQNGICLDGGNSPTWDVCAADFSAFMRAIDAHLTSQPSPLVFDGLYEPIEGQPCPVW